jgi:arsenite methyltransferase
MRNEQHAETSLDLEHLRLAIQEEYAAVARDPGRGYHFHTGRRLAKLLGYPSDWLEDIPEDAIESFAGTGNPFRMGRLAPGANIVDVGSGAGLDSLIAAKMVGPDGQVIGVDMTPAMLHKAQKSATDAGFSNVVFHIGFACS